MEEGGGGGEEREMEASDECQPLLSTTKVSLTVLSHVCCHPMPKLQLEFVPLEVWGGCKSFDRWPSLLQPSHASGRLCFCTPRLSQRLLVHSTT